MKDTYKTILVIVCGFWAIGFFFLYKKMFEKAEIFMAIGIGISLISLLFPSIAELITKGWYTLAKGMGWVSSRVLLSVVFYVFLMPIAFLFRIFTKDHLSLKRKKTSLFIERNHTYLPKDLEFPW